MHIDQERGSINFAQVNNLPLDDDVLAFLLKQVEKKTWFEACFEKQGPHQGVWKMSNYKIRKLGKEMSVIIKFETGVSSTFPRVPLH